MVKEGIGVNTASMGVRLVSFYGTSSSRRGHSSLVSQPMSSKILKYIIVCLLFCALVVAPPASPTTCDSSTPCGGGETCYACDAVSRPLIEPVRHFTASTTAFSTLDATVDYSYSNHELTFSVTFNAFDVVHGVALNDIAAHLLQPASAPVDFTAGITGAVTVTYDLTDIAVYSVHIRSFANDDAAVAEATVTNYLLTNQAKVVLLDSIGNSLGIAPLLYEPSGCDNACGSADTSTCGICIVGTHVGATQLSPQIVGDPHFIGFDGVEYEYQGEPDRVFVLLSDDTTTVNALFVAADLPGSTVMGAICINMCNNSVTFREKEILINGTAVALNGSYGSDSCK